MDLGFLAVIYLILLVIITTVVISGILRYKNPPKDYAPDILSLGNQNSVANYGDIKDNLLVPGASSFIGFFNIKGGDKTGNLNGDMKTLINLGGILSLEVSPVPSKVGVEYSASKNSSNTTAQIRIATYGDKGYTVEQISIPDIPLQRWICIGILRDGRRIDVVYDNKIVASRRLENNLPVQPYGDLKVGVEGENGKTGLIGNCRHIFLIPERMNVNDLTQLRDNYFNPDNSMKEETLPIPFIKTNLSAISLPGLAGVSAPPSNTLKKWYTPYN